LSLLLEPAQVASNEAHVLVAPLFGLDAGEFNGVLAAAALFGVGIRQLESAGLGCQAKKSTVFQRVSGSRERLFKRRADLLRQYS